MRHNTSIKVFQVLYWIKLFKRTVHVWQNVTHSLCCSSSRNQYNMCLFRLKKEIFSRWDTLFLSFICSFCCCFCWYFFVVFFCRCSIFQPNASLTPRFAIGFATDFLSRITIITNVWNAAFDTKNVLCVCVQRGLCFL